MSVFTADFSTNHSGCITCETSSPLLLLLWVARTKPNSKKSLESFFIIAVDFWVLRKRDEKRSWTRHLRVPKGGSLEPWNFCCGARSPIIILTGALILFWLWSPEPKDILRGARSPAFSNLIIRVPRLHWFLITAFLCLFARVNGHKETESKERTVYNTSIRGYLSL